MKKSLFVHAREHSEKKAYQVSVKQSAFIAYEEYLEKQIQKLKVKIMF